MIESRVLEPKTGPERRAGYQTNFPPTAVDYDEDGGKTVGKWELFDEIHGNGVPWSGWDGKLL